MARWATDTWRWLQQMYTDRLGADAIALPPSAGGTGVTSLAQAVAAQQEATTSPSVTALTQSKTGVTLTSPATGSLLASQTTTITWDSAFADATYEVTLSFHPTKNATSGSVSVDSQTDTQVVVRLTNTASGSAPAAGTLDITGVHA
jgi:hypothetical protein